MGKSGAAGRARPTGKVKKMLDQSRKATFRTVMAQGQVFTPCVWDCYSAKAAEMAGFKAILLSGASLGFSMSGVPDLGLHNQEELVWATDRISDYSPLPLIIDADDGFGDVVQAYRTCRRLAKAGAAAILLEDTPNERGSARFGRAMEAATLAGKVDGNVPHEVISKELWLAKIKAALEACEGSDCVVIARTESKLEKGLEDAIERCVRAEELGVEMTYVHGLRTLDECKTGGGSAAWLEDVWRRGDSERRSLRRVSTTSQRWASTLSPCIILKRARCTACSTSASTCFVTEARDTPTSTRWAVSRRRSSAPRRNATAAGWNLKRNGKSYDASLHPRHGSAVRLTLAEEGGPNCGRPSFPTRRQ